MSPVNAISHYHATRSSPFRVSAMGIEIDCHLFFNFWADLPNRTGFRPEQRPLVLHLSFASRLFSISSGLFDVLGIFLTLSGLFNVLGPAASRT